MPHLNSSVLNNEAPSELWEFINPLFKRDQPELLNRITRKQRPANAPPILPIASPGAAGTRTSARQAAQVLPDGTTPLPQGVKFITDGSTQGEVNAAGVLVGPQGQQYVDISALTTHMANIQRAQGTIAADLKALKASNEHLWRENLEVRDVQKRHEETINLIAHFLERLFGTEGEGLKGLKEAMLRSGISAARAPREETDTGDRTAKKRRLGEDRMIMSGKDDVDERMVEISSGQYCSTIYVEHFSRAKAGLMKQIRLDSATTTASASRLARNGPGRKARRVPLPAPVTRTGHPWRSGSRHCHQKASPRRPVGHPHQDGRPLLVLRRTRTLRRTYHQ